MVPGAIALALLAGCATRPAPPPAAAKSANKSEMLRVLGDSAALMTIELLDRQAARREAQGIRLTPEVMQLLARFAVERQRTGAWPDAGEITLPPGVSELRFREDAGALRIEVVGACPFLARLLPEGTMVLFPPAPKPAQSASDTPAVGGDRSGEPADPRTPD